MMLKYFRYKQTPAGQVLNERLANKSSVLLGVTSFTLGEFEVKAKGEAPECGDILLLPVKGSKQLSMQLNVVQVSPLITPIGGWNAKCEGPAQAQFDVRFAEITCDECKQAYALEFIDYSGDTQADAISGMNIQGWNANLEQQICPSCHSK